MPYPLFDLPCNSLRCSSLTLPAWQVLEAHKTLLKALHLSPSDDILRFNVALALQVPPVALAACPCTHQPLAPPLPSLPSCHLAGGAGWLAKRLTATRWLHRPDSSSSC